jgi:hypothetical protein
LAIKFNLLNDFISAVNFLPNNPKTYAEMMDKIIAYPDFRFFKLLLYFVLVFLYPLNLGFFKIYRKIDLGEKPELKDLFSGYNGSNFFIFAGYYIFWIIIFSYAMQTIVLGILWIFITLFSAPLMFFMDKRILETIGLNFKMLKIYFVEIFVGVFVAFFFKYLGLLFFGIGFLFTFPFYNAMIYALYRNIFTEKELPK